MDKETLRHLFQSDEADNIPPLLFSEYSKKPFETCLVSEKGLHEVDFYIINKVFNKRGEATMEMALSFDSAEEQNEGYSEASRQNLLTFFQENFFPNEDLKACNFCTEGQFGQGDFSLMAFCQKGYYLKPSAYGMCQTCMEKANNSISLETRKIYDDFFEEHFPGVPHDFNLIPALA